MSLEHSPARKGSTEPDNNDPGYWHKLINEKVAAEYLDLTDRTMQKMRQQGGGPRFVKISARCVKYRRIDLNAYNESLLRSSTSDPGPEADAA